MSPTVATLATLGVLLLVPARAQPTQPAPAAVPSEAAAPASGMDISLAPLVRDTSVSGDARRFAQDWWTSQGTSGGVDQLRFNRAYNNGWKLDFLGRANFNENDYDVGLNFVNPDVGFVRAGFTEYRKYFDGQGGYYPLFSTTSFSLDQDLHLDIGKIYIDAGLTLPNWPILTLGYEQQFTNGQKSLIEWGGVQQTLVEPSGFLPSGSVTKRIFPSYEHINETTHILKAAVDYTLLDIHLKDDFRYEWYTDDTARNDMVTLNLSTGAAKTQTFNEHHNHGVGFETLTMDNQPCEKVYWSAGYLCTNLQGDYGLHLITTGLPLATSDRFWFSNVVSFGQDSQVTDVNLMVGPFGGAVFFAGVRGEDTHTQGFADVVEANVANSAGPIEIASSDSEKKELEGTVGMRYTSIPRTTLYADARILVGKTDDTWMENGDSLGAIDLVREAQITRQYYTAGFNSAPWSRVSISGRFRHSVRDNDYGNSVDLNPDTGYPGLLTGERLTSDDGMLKLSLRVSGKLQLFLGYQYSATNIHNRAHAITAPLLNPPLVVPATDMDTGAFHSRTYSTSATWSPLSRLYLTGVFNYQNAISDAFLDASNSIQPYRSNIYSVITSAGYAVNDQSDLNLEYSFIHADSFTDHLDSATPPAGYVSSDYGLPYGTTSDQHALTINFTRRISVRTTARLGASYFSFHDSANAGISNYTAFSAVGSCTIRF
jgi:hypothetical protein